MQIHLGRVDFYGRDRLLEGQIGEMTYLFPTPLYKWMSNSKSDGFRALAGNSLRSSHLFAPSLPLQQKSYLVSRCSGRYLLHLFLVMSVAFVLSKNPNYHRR